MNNFTPTRKTNCIDALKKELKDGNIIRYDGYHSSVEVLPRIFIDIVHNSDNLFQHSGSLKDYYKDPTQEKKTIEIDRATLINTLKEIEGEYMVHKVRCEGSGCCQYSTWAAYLL